MAIRSVAAALEPEEILFENAKVSLCLLVNRHAKTLRIFDFRAGADPTKRGYVLSIAQREGVERVYTVVERDEVSVWIRLGFEREGTIPGFFKRSDAYVLGASVPPALGAAPVGSGEVVIDIQALAEGVLQRAKRVAKDLGPPSPRTVRVQHATDAIAKRAVASAARSGRALTRFEGFGRDVERREFYATARGGWSLVLSVERQLCFDNAFVEVLVAPKTERDVALTRLALHHLCEQLSDEGTVACFAWTPIDDVGLAAAFLANGFRRTGILPAHLVVRGRRAGAFLWTRKLTVPVDPDE
jgi:hypothetical protein